MDGAERNEEIEKDSPADDMYQRKYHRSQKKSENLETRFTVSWHIYIYGTPESPESVMIMCTQRNISSHGSSTPPRRKTDGAKMGHT